MSFYKDQQRAFQTLDQSLQVGLKNRTNLSISKISYEITKNYPVSHLAIKKQISLFAKSHDLKIIDDDLVME